MLATILAPEYTIQIAFVQWNAARNSTRNSARNLSDLHFLPDGEERSHACAFYTIMGWFAVEIQHFHLELYQLHHLLQKFEFKEFLTKTPAIAKEDWGFNAAFPRRTSTYRLV